MGSFLIFRDNFNEIDDIIPPIYKSFISVFKGIKGQALKDETTGEEITLSYYKFFKENGEDLFFQRFIPISETISGYQGSELWMECQAMPISEHDHGGNLLVGCGDKNEDVIYFEYGEGLEIVAKNIYHFMMNLQFVSDADVDYSKLYKKWDEKFWRILKNDN